jgi:uncharacterized membrane protein
MAREIEYLLLIAASLVGLAISAYFSLVYFRLVAPDARHVPQFCRLGERVCEGLVFRREGRLFFGIPNSLLGIGFYVLVLDTVLSGRLASTPWMRDTLLACAGLTVIIGGYLTWVLLVRLRTPCALCLVSHSLNALIAGILLYMRQAS